MRSDQATLYSLSDAPPGDPLDCVTAALPLLSRRYGAVQQVGPGRALSVRALLRAYRPGVDRMLFDFTAPHDHSWAFDMLDDAPSAVLLGCYNLAQGVALADLRSAQRYAAGGIRFSPDATIGVLDGATPSLTATTLSRPAALITPSAEARDLVLAVAPGAVETAYAALLEIRGVTSSLTILTVSKRDAVDLADIVAAFGMTAAHVQHVQYRAEFAAAMGGARGVIDINERHAPASAAAFVAGCIGAPVLTLTTVKGANAAAAFVASSPRRDPAAAHEFTAARPITAFANNLHALIETGFARALQQTSAA